MQPLVSIIIPTYNRADLIGPTLESALAQTYANIEVIVSDNASTDGTAAVVRRYAASDPRVRLHVNERNLGPVLNWQAGLNKAAGDYAKILWSDDLIAPEFVEQTLAMFLNNPALAFVFTQVAVGAAPESAQPVYRCYEASGIYPSVKFVEGIVRGHSLPYSPGCALFRTDVLKKSLVTDNPLFENRYLQNGAGPDLLMFLMAARQAPEFGYLNRPLAFFRSHGGSITTTASATALGIDYAKAITWYLYQYAGKTMALRYWNHAFKKKKLYRRRHRPILRSFLFKDRQVSCLDPVNLLFLAGCFLLPSRVYLKLVRIDA